MSIPTTLDDIKARNHDAGNHFFDRDTMRFFRSRISERVYPNIHGTGTLFVTSERGPDNIRRYSVRIALPDGSIDAASRFGDYHSLSGAHRAADRLSRAHLAQCLASPDDIGTAHYADWTATLHTTTGDVCSKCLKPRQENPS